MHDVSNHLLKFNRHVLYKNWGCGVGCVEELHHEPGDPSSDVKSFPDPSPSLSLTCFLSISTILTEGKKHQKYT